MKLPDPKRLVGRVFPIANWARTYRSDTAVGDFIAGLTVALTLIPQSIAYASLAGFEPQYGLYASFVGGFVYAVMGTCPQINIGPTALLSLMTFTYTNGTNPDFAVLLCFIGGIVQLIAGIAQLGFLVEFVSLPVVSGFTSAAAVTIACSQIKGLLGLKFKAETFVSTWDNVFKHIQDTRLQDTLLSLVCCIVLLGMKAMKDIRLKDPEDEKGRKTTRVIQKTLWFVGVSRNAVVVVVAAVLAYFVHQDKNEPLILTGDITPGLPTPQPPPFSTTVGNTTYTAGGMFSHLGSGLLVVPIVGIISNVAIAKAFSKGKMLDATQEIVALAACNIVGAFFKSFPVNGSFTRSAVSDASGVRTPAAGFYTGIIVLMTLALLTQYFYFIPRAALAAVIVCAVLHMVDIAIIKRLWATSRLDLIPLLGTFVCCLALGIEMGLICGVGIDVLLLLYYHSRPPLDVQFVDDGVLLPHYAIHPVGGLHFAGAERVRSKLASLRNSKNKINSIPTLTVVPSSYNYTNDNGVSRVENGIRGLNHTNTEANNESLENSDENNSPTVVINDVGVTGSANREGNINAMSMENNAGRLGNEHSEVRNGTAVRERARTSYVLVIYCDGLYRMDYTFLQSLKMLVTEWSRSGRVVWCNVKPAVREQLSSTLDDPAFCESDHLSLYLNSISLADETQNLGTNDTQL